MSYDIVVIGGGSAGLAAAKSAYDPSLKIAIIEKENQLGGILNQCIHNGFGLTTFKEELTGPEYAARFMDDLPTNVEIMLATTVIDIIKSEHFILKISSQEYGPRTIESKAIIIATGCYERTRGMIEIPGERPKGIIPAGSAQRYLNIEGYLVGKRVLILGSGDIGLIMARRLTLEGAKVLGVAEIMPYSNGLNRNIVQCLHDFDIPLYLSHAVKDIKGKDVLQQITIQQVDKDFKPIAGTEKVFDVDTLLLSVGLIPDLAMFDSLHLQLDAITKSAVVNQRYQTSIPGLFVCGNALHVHDLVDYVSKESLKAGKYAKAYVKSSVTSTLKEVKIQISHPIRYVVPQMITFEELDSELECMLRVSKKITQGVIKVFQEDRLIYNKQVRHLAPSEMISLIINRDKIVNQEPLKIVVEEVK